jgi:hypothetical protein
MARIFSLLLRAQLEFFGAPRKDAAASRGIKQPPAFVNT